MTGYYGIFQTMCYHIISWIFKLSTAIYFKQVKAKGRENIPKEGPVIFVIGPHVNQFIDPVVLTQQCQRKISFLCAEKSMNEPGVGFLLRSFNPIAVNRPQDNAVKGQGRLKQIDMSSCHIIGMNTKFTNQLKPNDFISFPKGYGEAKVLDVLSDTEIVLELGTITELEKKRLSALINNSNRVEYKCMPHIEQETVYQQVHAELNSGATVGIFPEGGSHDRTQMLPLKAGVTVMAMGAMAKYKDLDVKIVPCGMNYTQAHRFRSRVGVEFGKPITVASELVEGFKCGGEQKRKACATLLNQIQEGLKTVTTNVDNYETLQYIKATRKLYKPAQKKLGLFEKIDIDRRLSIGYEQFKNNSKSMDVQGRIISHQHILKYYHITDYQISQTYRYDQNFKTLLELSKRSSRFLLFFLLSAPGIILNLPAAIIVDYISDRKAKAALKRSAVKIYGRDVISTWKVMSSYIFLPATYAFYTFATLMYLKDQDVDFKYKSLIPILVWCLLPYVSYISIILFEKSQDIKKSIRPLSIAFFDPKTAKLLRQNHNKLSKEVSEVINEFNFNLSPDFNDSNNEEKPATKEVTQENVLDISNLSQTLLRDKSTEMSNGFLHQCFRMDWFEEGEDENSTASVISDKAKVSTISEKKPKKKKEDDAESVLLHLSKTSPTPSVHKEKENKRSRRAYEYYKTSKIPELFKRKTRRLLRFDDSLLNSYNNARKRTEST